MKLTDEQLDTLRHMLGINTPYDRVPLPYRNYAAVDPGDTRFAELEQLGAVECYLHPRPGFKYDYYRCTEAGKDAAVRSHRTIRKTKAKRVYAKFLEVSESFQELTFREFITSTDFAQARADA